MGILSLGDEGLLETLGLSELSSSDLDVLTVLTVLTVLAAQLSSMLFKGVRTGDVAGGVRGSSTTISGRGKLDCWLKNPGVPGSESSLKQLPLASMTVLTERTVLSDSVEESLLTSKHIAGGV